jgi:hypothetical protein
MNEVMEARYAALFANYGEGIPTSVPSATQTAKAVISSYLERDRNILSSDACLLLISLYDNMIARPFSEGQSLLPSATDYFARLAPDGIDVNKLSLPQQEDPNALQESISDLQYLLDQLADLGHPPATARDVLNVINDRWGSFKFSEFAKGPNPII